jgi:hypothetical protein
MEEVEPAGGVLSRGSPVTDNLISKDTFRTKLKMIKRNL